jgi:hypothetical protein
MQSAMNNLDVHTHAYMTAGSTGAPYRMNAGTAVTGTTTGSAAATAYSDGCANPTACTSY